LNKSLIFLFILVIYLIPVCAAGSQSVQLTVKPTISVEITEEWNIINHSNIPINVYKENGTVYIMAPSDTWQKVNLN
jgi:hypothetical protein